MCLLTATPRNQDARDVYNQIKLFHPDDITLLPIDPPNLKVFRRIDKGERWLQGSLVHILIRRTRKHILRYYGYTEDTNRPCGNCPTGRAKQYLNEGKRAYVIVASSTSTSHNGSWRRYGTVLRKHTRGCTTRSVNTWDVRRASDTPRPPTRS